MQVERVEMECPICGQIHEVEKRKRETTTIIKGEEVIYEETYFFCKNADEDECEFESGRMVNENLLNARNAYRRIHGLLTSDEIVEIREKYGLSQVELAKLMGWGEATISRYESKAIQDESYDSMLRLVSKDPFKALEFLEKNKRQFGLKYLQIRKTIIDCLDSYGREFLSRQSLESEYVEYNEKSYLNGNKLLDVDKLECIISYYARMVKNLYKVKLMKMLWYSDVISYRDTGCAMTGLVYCHEKMGALPVGHYKIMGLENVQFEEVSAFDYDVSYLFYESENVDVDRLSKKEIEILDSVIKKFGAYSGKELKEYMHAETAYINTKPNEIISFELAKEIRPF